MTQTNLMRADEIAYVFNGAADHKYWRATIAGTRVRPEVNFNSRASFVRITYRVVSDDFTITFSKTSAAFGDFLASAYRSLGQVFAGLKAGGLSVHAVDEATAALRMEYDPRSKVCVVHIARHGDTWMDIEPLDFKAPIHADAEKTSETEKSALAAIDL